MLRKSSWVSLDTEADSLHSYPEKLCLLQISLPDTDVLIDPLSQLDMTALFKALASRELLIHGSDNDLRLMYAAQQFVPSKIFDTMWAARLLGFTAFGLNDLLSKLLGITLDKGSQKANWTRRPLTDKMAIYALNDSRHLRALADKLRSYIPQPVVDQVDDGQVDHRGWLQSRRVVSTMFVKLFGIDYAQDYGEQAVSELGAMVMLIQRSLAPLGATVTRVSCDDKGTGCIVLIVPAQFLIASAVLYRNLFQ